MKAIVTEQYEVIARKRAKLADGHMGWTGVMRTARGSDQTVVGYGKDFVGVRFPHTNGAVGSPGERAYAKLVTSEQIKQGEG